jgi:hypothetical protein
MRLISIPLARALAFVEFGSLNLSGQIYLPDLVQVLAEKCQFAKFPKPSEINLKDGIDLEMGTFRGKHINKLSINPSIIHVDGDISTDVSAGIILELLEWARTEHGINYSKDSITRWAYVSDIVFQTDFPFLEGQNKVLRNISEKLSIAVQGNLKEDLTFLPSQLNWSHDPLSRSSVIAPFTIQHRVGVPYEHNMFFSEAPIPTKLHLELIEELEASFKKVYELMD